MACNNNNNNNNNANSNNSNNINNKQMSVPFLILMLVDALQISEFFFELPFSLEQ